MKPNPNKVIDVLAIGEILGDFIGSKVTESLYDSTNFNRYWGGSPINFAANLQKLGCPSSVIGCVGNENLGNFLKHKVAEAGLSSDLIKQHPSLPSSIVLVSRTAGTPDFIPYRMADCQIEIDDIPESLLQTAKVVHTTTWPLSRNPSQKTLLQIAKKSQELKIQLSIDLNYAEPVWPNLIEAQQVCKEFISHGAWVKLSDDDAERFLGKQLDTNELISYFHNLGANLVVLTQGAKGSVISEKGKEAFFQAAEPIEVKDATGAGDAFWAGFVAAKLQNKPLNVCAEAAVNMASLKLQTIGPLPKNLDYSHIIP